MESSIPRQAEGETRSLHNCPGTPYLRSRANYALFLTELRDALGLPHPDIAGATHEFNDYVFERAVRHQRGRTPRPCALASSRLPDPALRQGARQAGRARRTGRSRSRHCRERRQDLVPERCGGADRRCLRRDCLLEGSHTVSDIASGYRKSKNLEKSITEVLASLARLGHITTRDGKTFEIRRM